MKKNYFISVIALALISNVAVSQTSATIGTRLTLNSSNRSSKFVAGAEMRSALQFGLSYQFLNSPIFATLTRDIYLSPNTEKKQSNYRAIESKVITDYIGLGSNLRNCFINVGFIRKRNENWTTYNFPLLGSSIQYGLELGVGYRSKSISFGYHPFLMIRPEFDPLSGFLRNGSINIRYHVFNQKKHDSVAKPVIFSIKLGFRAFSPKLNLNQYETQMKIGLAPAVKFSIIPRFKFLSLDFERDIYISLNGGSPFRDLNGFVGNSVISAMYHLPSNRVINGVGIGYAAITDHATLYSDRAGGKSPKFHFYNVRGMSLSIQKDFKNFDIEARQIIPFHNGKLSSNRFSIGIFRKLGK
jgi:hypothetical protein